ncbi:MAG TPA: Hsp20/alpha crystallin family protein [Candidatus Acidoferrales bacterium]|nr:Hsp20/alpha crystallin family protein [Candidatus Acidoferrales bacterium]
MFGLIPWNPYQELMSWHRDIDELFNRFFPSSGLEREQQGAAISWFPAMETFTKDGHQFVRLDLPGVDPKDVEVSVVNDTLVIRGERKRSQELTEKDYHYRETAYGRFERRLSPPAGVDRDKVNATYKNGVLEVSIPLPAQLTGKTIPIQIEESPTRKLAAA